MWLVVWIQILMFDTGHEECDISLDLCWEVAHQFDKLGLGGNINATGTGCTEMQGNGRCVIRYRAICTKFADTVGSGYFSVSS